MIFFGKTGTHFSGSCSSLRAAGSLRIFGSPTGAGTHYIDYMSELAFALFETAIGRCGIVWSARGIAAVQLPANSERATRSQMLRRFAAARESEPPAAVKRAIDDIAGLLKGEARELGHVAIDSEGVPDFHRRVYAIARGIRPGATLSYGDIAERLGDRILARDVAQALAQNPTPIIVPCHRVLAAGGKMGGFSAPGGVRTKLRLLSIEGAQYGEPLLFDRLPWAAAGRRPA
jgi:methylated-DNA-[protein]-cysteine S-methyltransferase